MPLGRSRRQSSSPTGSGRPATERTPSTIDLNRDAVSVRRSTIAGLSPFACAAATSSAFAASISGFAASIASATASSAAFFSAVVSVRSARAAARAFRPSAWISSATVMAYPSASSFRRLRFAVPAPS